MKFEVTALNKKEALRKAKEILGSKISGKIDEENLQVELIGEKKGFLGFGRKQSYAVEYAVTARGLSSKEEGFLEESLENISVDGEFRIRVNAEGIWLKVSSPEGKGKAVHYQEVKEALEKKEIVKVDWEKVQEALAEKQGEWIKIAPRKPELDRDAEIDVQISKDKLKAFLSYSPPLGGKGFSLEEAKIKIQEAGVSYGLKEEKLLEILRQGEKVEQILIAEGKPPLPGKDAEIKYCFEEKKKSVGREREDGSIDFYDLGLITNVQAGDVLAVKEEAQVGEPGINVSGEEIAPPKPRDRDLPSGKNVEKKDEKTLVAATAGQVVIEGFKINVLPVYEVKGDVDLSTGNIDFVGSVIVRGSVQEGFKIKAEGNVEIKGYVSGANIEASGEVVVHKGFIGKGKYFIKAGGDVRVKFVENGVISSDQKIVIADAAMHSELYAGDSIEIKGKKGLLVGGLARARNKIEAVVIGSSLGTTTTLEVGINPDLKEKLKELQAKLTEQRASLSKAEKALAILEQLKSKQGKLPQAKKIMYSKFKRTINTLEESIREKEQELNTIKERLSVTKQGSIIVLKRAFPGVVISFTHSQYRVRDEINTTRFIEEEGDVRQIPL